MTLTRADLRKLPLGSRVFDCDNDVWVKLYSRTQDEDGWRLLDMVTDLFDVPVYEISEGVSPGSEPLTYGPLTLTPKGAGNNVDTVRKSDVLEVMTRYAAAYGWGDSALDALEEIGITMTPKKILVTLEIPVAGEGVLEAIADPRKFVVDEWISTDWVKDVEVVDP